MKKISGNIINFIKKHDNIFVLCLIILSIFGITMNIRITDCDELWNFQSIYKMTLGFQIYKDFNVIITPLFFFIGKTLFKLFGANFLTFRIYNVIIMSCLYFVVYILMKGLSKNKKISVIVVLSLILLKNYYVVRCQASYNQMVLIFYFIGVYICFKNCKSKSFIQGIIIFLIFLTKQNMVVYYSIGLVAYEFIKITNLKNKVINLMKEFMIALFLLIIFLIYLYINNNLFSFINYTVLGIGEFNKENIALNISYIILALFFISINIVSIKFLRRYKYKEEKIQQLIIVNCFAIPLTFMMYPIMNFAHFITANYLNIIVFINVVYILWKEIGLLKYKKIIKTILILLIIYEIVLSTWSFIFWIKNIKENYNIEKNSPFYGGMLSEEQLKNINNVCEYIKNSKQNVIILSSKAAFYMVPLQRNNGYFDLPFKR